MIRIKNVTKDYGSNKGVFDLSFEVQDQETFGLLGMEGAGKTTLLQILIMQIIYAFLKMLRISV